MPRESRKRSESGVYHIMLRGINRQQIFEDDKDYRRFLETLEKYREECGYSLYGYCLMPNHVHLIVVLGCNPESSNNTKLNTVIGQLKSGISREIHEKEPNMVVWQRSFHDHIIRNQKAYEKIWLYIDSNPQLWDKDCFYIDDFDW